MLEIPCTTNTCIMTKGLPPILYSNTTVGIAVVADEHEDNPR